MTIIWLNATQRACTLFPSPVLAYIQIYRSSARFMPDRVKREAEERFVYARPIFLSNGYFISHTFWHSRQMRRKKRGVWTLPRETRNCFMELSLSFRFSRSFAAKTRFLSVETVILINRALWLANPLKFLISHRRWIIIIFSFFFFSFLRARECIPRQHARLLLALSLI